jgi:hypothetical protein
MQSEKKTESVNKQTVTTTKDGTITYHYRGIHYNMPYTDKDIHDIDTVLDYMKENGISRKFLLDDSDAILNFMKERGISRKLFFK